MRGPATSGPLSTFYGATFSPRAVVASPNRFGPPRPSAAPNRQLRPSEALALQASLAKRISALNLSDTGHSAGFGEVASCSEAEIVLHNLLPLIPLQIRLRSLLPTSLLSHFRFTKKHQHSN